jgi:prephenate dehydrogenase
VTGSSARPRVAIVGGGGAMGRLFARLLGGAARELYLFDYFGTGPRPASLSLLVDDLRLGANARQLSGGVVGLARSDALAGSPSLFSLTSGEPRGDRALAWFGPGLGGSAPEPTLPAKPTGLADLLDRCAAMPGGFTVIAGQPADAELLLPRADVVLLALGFEDRVSFATTLRGYARWLRPGCLVVDLGSTKSQPMAILQRELPPEIGLLGAHPLFGPTVSDLTGLIVAAVDPDDGRPVSRWRDWFLGQLAEQRMIVTPASAREHDDAMAFVQALTHFALLSFAYTFVRLDQDPADLLPLRTPIFEPLLYLASRVAYLARTSPDTYRSIQAFSTRPDARDAFLEAARELLAAIEQTTDGAAEGERDSDPLGELFRRYGQPWSPEGRDRRERQRREHLLDMGSHLVDNLNQLRQDVVASVGQVRAFEERRAGQPPRIVVGVVDLDLLAPGKQDVATRIRLRRLNLPLGSVPGESVAGCEAGQDEVVPLARARLLGDSELLDWLQRTGQLVERRSYPLLLPAWFDRDVLVRLVKGISENAAADPGSRVWDVELAPLETLTTPPPGTRAGLVTLVVVVHPNELVQARRAAQRAGEPEFRDQIRQIDAALAEIRQGAVAVPGRTALGAKKDRLKHARKALVDRRTAEIDREVRRAARALVQRTADVAVQWLLAHGCAPVASPPRESIL